MVNNGSHPKLKTSNVLQNRSIFYGTGTQNDYNCVLLSKSRLTPFFYFSVCPLSVLLISPAILSATGPRSTPPPLMIND